MKKRYILALCLLAVTAIAAPAISSIVDKWRRLYTTGAGEAPIAVIARSLHESPSTAGNIQVYDDETQLFRDINATELPTFVGVATATLTSAAAATAVNLVPATAVPAGKKIYVTNYTAYVSGGTDWATTANVKLQDTNSSAVDFVTLTASALDGNEVHGPFSDSATLEAAFKSGTGGTAGKGLQVKGDANGTGSSLIVNVTYFIK